MTKDSKQRRVRLAGGLIILAVSCAAYAAWVSLLDDGRAPAARADDVQEAAPAPANDPQLASLQRRLAALERARTTGSRDDSADLAALKRELEAMAERLEDLADHAPGDGDARTEPPFEAAAQHERARTTRIVHFLDERFASEPRDEPWARAVEQDVSGSLARELGAAPERILCQASMCKVEMTHASGERERAFIHKLVHVRALGDTEAFSAREQADDGTVTTTTFVARAGTRLPEPPVL